MRIKMQKGKQKQLILKAKSARTWEGLANLVKVKKLYLSGDLKREKVLLSEQTYKMLCELAKKSWSKYIKEIKDDSWGKSLGGKNSYGSTKEIKYPKESSKFAEFYGIMLGDGNLTIKKAYKVGSYQIRIVGDSRHDKEYLTDYVIPLIKSLFRIEVVKSKIKNRNALVLTATGKNLAEFLESRGFKAGDKIKNQLGIPQWIKDNKSYLKWCLRGLYDTDGSIYKLTNQNSYQICFTNYNNLLLNEVRNALLNFGIGVSRISKGRDITITKRSELRKFLNEIGFSNSKHLRKIKMWNIAS